VGEQYLQAFFSGICATTLPQPSFGLFYPILVNQQPARLLVRDSPNPQRRGWLEQTAKELLRSLLFPDPSAVHGEAKSTLEMSGVLFVESFQLLHRLVRETGWSRQHSEAKEGRCAPGSYLGGDFEELSCRMPLSRAGEATRQIKQRTLAENNRLIPTIARTSGHHAQRRLLLLRDHRIDNGTFAALPRRTGRI
jgi:hypothetical protein